MKIIKLNAINSTNSFLKELAQDAALKNFTVAVTNNQTNGRGQQVNKWISKPFKNLTFSVFITFSDLQIQKKKYLNFAVSLAIYESLLDLNIPRTTIKWPNDILSANKKICGVLIENSIKGSKIKSSIIGIGLNTNQQVFPDFLKNVTSLKNLTGKNYDLDILLKQIVEKIKEKVKLLDDNNFADLEKSYLNVLYKINIPTIFKNSEDVLFMGIITGISKDGKLQIQLEDETIKEFGIKEITFI
ncbi:biotin--[acetyl-CoA-carboxylase] ligase [Polaribacter sp. SA4-10]|uniref:biotin--[acetyl-CoA-carboxylase] ligase n=1 Tax=Polaribacter sp. SA4-10 TaxID=754397 RepID=UPI000B3C21EE|nr:biotin--[acetyl-CoA-carboxylase] ligase [Polaribacter sp. SA4-10]ARV07766.1 biotin--[acetyl-CoA-carboxylase] ligase [Polaribacter sp. SA4-10]